MTTPEPAPCEPIDSMTPLEYLACADREWAAGNHQEAAGLLWKATKATFVGLAEERGLEHDEYMLDLAKALEVKKESSQGYFVGSLIVGTLMRDHYEMDVLEGSELENTYQLNRKFLIEQHGDPR